MLLHFGLYHLCQAWFTWRKVNSFESRSLLFTSKDTISISFFCFGGQDTALCPRPCSPLSMSLLAFSRRSWIYGTWTIGERRSISVSSAYSGHWSLWKFCRECMSCVVITNWIRANHTKPLRAMSRCRLPSRSTADERYTRISRWRAMVWFDR